MRKVLSSLPDFVVQVLEEFGDGAFRFVNEEESMRLVNKISSLKEGGYASVIVTRFQSDIQFAFAPLMEEAEKGSLISDFVIVGVSSYQEVEHVNSFSKGRFKVHAFQADQLEEAALQLIKLL